MATLLLKNYFGEVARVVIHDAIEVILVEDITTGSVGKVHGNGLFEFLHFAQGCLAVAEVIAVLAVFPVAIILKVDLVGFHVHEVDKSEI